MNEAYCGQRTKCGYGGSGCAYLSLKVNPPVPCYLAFTKELFEPGNMEKAPEMTKKGHKGLEAFIDS